MPPETKPREQIAIVILIRMKDWLQTKAQMSTSFSQLASGLALMRQNDDPRMQEDDQGPFMQILYLNIRNFYTRSVGR